MTATANPNQQSPDLDSLRSTGGADIPENQAPPQKMTNPKKHYLLCVAAGLVGAAALALGIFGAFGTPYIEAVAPWLILISLFFLLPGIVGIYRGPGVPSTHVIPRPKNRKPIDYAAGAGGAAGPAPTA
ncbi:hypothetical protein [Corynebacterium glyciniphilum]|uniref:hypothetical protein n=1 Tax=Corynebacterium glyciniphilum TaxID=1404244 RepID=UPI002651924F|nr:hypothetical protein [Corynebacterium glyciniphilum]MDN5682603.1 hypothetical protein [Corynebacterium glyciniphilum]